MEIFSEPLSRRYRASCCSWASLCNFILVLIAIIIPYLWAFTSESFWLKQSTYREQATLAFTHKVLVELEIVDSTLSNPYSALIWSTEPAVNAVANQLYRPAKILANSNDDNSDGKVDSVNITVDFPLSDDEQVVGVKALAFFNYQLNDRVSDMNCIVTDRLFQSVKCSLALRHSLTGKNHDGRLGSVPRFYLKASIQTLCGWYLGLEPEITVVDKRWLFDLLRRRAAARHKWIFVRIFDTVVLKWYHPSSSPNAHVHADHMMK